MGDFKRFVPQLIWKKEFMIHERELNGEVRLYPAGHKTEVRVTLESDYPTDVFGAPRDLCFYIYDENKKDRNNGERLLFSVRVYDWKEALEELNRWRGNKTFWNYYEPELTALYNWIYKKIELKGGGYSE